MGSFFQSVGRVRLIVETESYFTEKYANDNERLGAFVGRSFNFQKKSNKKSIFYEKVKSFF